MTQNLDWLKRLFGGPPVARTMEEWVAQYEWLWSKFKRKDLDRYNEVLKDEIKRNRTILPTLADNG